MAADAAQSMRDIVTQFQSFLQSLTLAKKIILFGVIGLIVAGMSGMVYVANRQTWTPLYSNISTADAAPVKEKLDKAQISSQVGPGGTSILVATARVDEARLALARERVTLGSSLGFADLFIGQPSLGETDFQQQVKFRIALEGELSRLINKIQGIRSSKVTLAIPKKTLFVDQEQKSTASVVVEPQTGTQ